MVVLKYEEATVLPSKTPNRGNNITGTKAVAPRGRDSNIHQQAIMAATAAVLFAAEFISRGLKKYNKQNSTDPRKNPANFIGVHPLPDFFIIHYS